MSKYDLPIVVLRNMLETYERVMVTGAPNTGKTTLVDGIENYMPIPCEVIHTDKYLTEGLEWSGVSQRIADDLEDKLCYLAEGVVTARVIRKMKSKDRPQALLILTGPPYESHNKGQAARAKGLLTTLAKCRAKGILDDMLVVEIQRSAE